MGSRSPRVTSSPRLSSSGESAVCALCDSPFTARASKRDFVPICPRCRRLNRGSLRWEAQYRPQEGSAVKHAYTKLFLAIRAKALEDGALNDWKKYWVERSEMQKIWGVLHDEVTRQKLNRGSGIVTLSHD
jgi:hypothetical protein